MFAIVDIETCGGSFQFKKGRIIEICILVHDGLTIVDKLSTLINPECYISPRFTEIHGITNEMVKDSPKFYEVAKDIVRLTENCIFVAHNVSFDYGFIKDEFASLGYKYKRETLCTVRLSRKLIPGKISYSLGNLCDTLGIYNEARHRAEGDAMATAELFDRLIQLKTVHPQYRKMGIEDIMARRIDKIKQYVLKKLPEECGVYYFKDKDGNIIYIGKSNNMYARAQSHFNNDAKKAKNMLNDMYNVDFEVTGSELVALLLEAEEIKKHKPLYNRAKKNDQFQYSIDCFTDEKGIINFQLMPTSEAQSPIISFNTVSNASERIGNWIEEFELCPKHCGVEKASGPCFNFQIKKCKGVCCDAESREDYNARVNKVLARYHFDFKTFLIIDKGRHPEEKSAILIENGKYYGYGYFDNDLSINSLDDCKNNIKKATYYPDADELLRSFLKRKNYKTLSFKNSP